MYAFLTYLLSKTNAFVYSQETVLLKSNIFKNKVASFNIQSLSEETQLKLLLIIYLYLIIYFFKLGNNIIDLSKLQKELDREKLLRSSISKLTHELKNPIAVCNGYLEMIDINKKDKSKKYIDIITNEIKRSKTIIDEFSSFGKLKTINKEEIDITYLLEDTISLLKPLFKQNKSAIHLQTKEDIYIKADYNKLKQVFINLLKNTIEAKKENTPLDVKVTVNQNKQNVIIKIIDNGIGMDKETLNKVLDVFFTTKPNGTGIGLAFSKEVIEQLIELNILVDLDEKYISNIKNLTEINCARIFIEITDKCNLNCKHCYGGFACNNTNYLSVQTIEQILNQAVQLGVYEFDITGGEPLLYKDLEEVLSKLYDAGMLISIFTNLTLMTKNHLELFKKYGVKKIITSIDSCYADVHDEFRGGVGSFNKTIKNLNLIKESGIEVSVNTMIGNHNIQYIYPTSYSPPFSLQHML